MATPAQDPIISPSSRIIIVGSGVFGLSTALWLSKTGYKNVTAYDMQPLDQKAFNPAAGMDSASADVNKIMRLSYGTEIEYQRLAFEASEIWKEWNEELAATTPTSLPQGLSPGDKLWHHSGMLRLSATREYGDFELRTLENMVKDGLRDQQFMCDNLEDIERAKKRGWAHKLDPLDRKKRLGFNTAVLDSTAGFVSADKACLWTLHLARSSGVKFVLDPIKGKVTGVINGPGGKVTGIKTADDAEHTGDLVILACGGWTPSLVPEVRHLLETTAGSVATIQLSKKMVDLWVRYSPLNMPVVTWGMKEGKGVYCLPRTTKGVIKLGYRARKWTNFDDVGGQRISVPKTAHVTKKKESNIPLQALDAIKEFIKLNMPDLLPLGFSSTKLCWYTDSIDNSFVIDHVPNRSGLVVCSGGSGHGFKFLPLLGREVIPVLEGRGQDTVYGRMWAWRDKPRGQKRNGLEEGETGPRVLSKQKMASPEDWTSSIPVNVKSKL